MNEETTEMVAQTMLPQARPNRQGASEVAAMAREQALIQALILGAKMDRRDEAECYARVMVAMERPGMADDSQYEFKRGGTPIVGPSVYLAREFARIWGNIKHGKQVVDASMLGRDDDFVLVRGYALDLETLAYAESESRFRPRVQRKIKATGKTEWVVPDERDLRELVNKHGSICQRNAILEILPSDMIDEACKAADETLRRAAKGEIKQTHEDAIRRLALAFHKLGVSTEMLEGRAGHALKLTTEAELLELRKIYSDLMQGKAKREDFFKFESDDEATERAADVTEKIRKAKEGQSDVDTKSGDAQTGIPVVDEAAAAAEAQRKLDEKKEAASKDKSSR